MKRGMEVITRVGKARGVVNLRKRVAMDNSTRPVADNDIHKGAKEEERPGPERSSHPGLDKNGLPNNPIAIAADMLGANEDHSQG